MENIEERQYSVKCTVGDMLRRFRIKGTNKHQLYEALCEEVKTDDGAQLFWTDDEDDQCVLNTAADLDEAIQQAQSGVIRIFVKKVKPAMSMTAPVTITPVQTDAPTGINPIDQRPLTAAGRDDGAVHNATCDLCDAFIVGHRFRCLMCDDYDLCANCESTGAHNTHAMMRIVDPNITHIPWGARITEDALRLRRSFQENLGSNAKTADEKFKEFTKNGLHFLTGVGSVVTDALSNFGIDATYEVRHGGQKLGTKDDTTPNPTAPDMTPTPEAPTFPMPPSIKQFVRPAKPEDLTVCHPPFVTEEKPKEQKVETPVVQKTEEKKVAQTEKPKKCSDAAVNSLLDEVRDKGAAYREMVEKKAATEANKKKIEMEKKRKEAEVKLKMKQTKVKAPEESSVFSQVKKDNTPSFVRRSFQTEDDSDGGFPDQKESRRSFENDSTSRTFGESRCGGSGFGSATAAGFGRSGLDNQRSDFGNRTCAPGFGPRPGFSRPGFGGHEEHCRGGFCDCGIPFESQGFGNHQSGFGSNSGFGSHANQGSRPGFGEARNQGFGSRGGFQNTKSGFGDTTGQGFGNQGGYQSSRPGFGDRGQSFGGGFQSHRPGFGKGSSEEFGNEKCGFGSASTGFGNQGNIGSGTGGFGASSRPKGARWAFEYGPEYDDSQDDEIVGGGFTGTGLGRVKRSSATDTACDEKVKRASDGFPNPPVEVIKKMVAPIRKAAEDKNAPKEFAPPPPVQPKQEKKPEETKAEEAKKEETTQEKPRSNEEFFQMVRQKIQEQQNATAPEVEDDGVVVEIDQESIGSDIITFPEDCDSDGWVDATEKAAAQEAQNRSEEVLATTITYPSLPSESASLIDFFQEETNQSNNVNVDETFSALITLGFSDTQARRAISHCGCDLNKCIDYNSSQE